MEVFSSRLGRTNPTINPSIRERRFVRGRLARLEGSGVLWGALGGILGAALGAQEGQKSSTFTEACKSRRFLAKKK